MSQLKLFCFYFYKHPFLLQVNMLRQLHSNQSDCTISVLSLCYWHNSQLWEKDVSCVITAPVPGENA